MGTKERRSELLRSWWPLSSPARVLKLALFLWLGRTAGVGGWMIIDGALPSQSVRALGDLDEMGVNSAEASVQRLCAAGKAPLPSSGH